MSADPRAVVEALEKVIVGKREQIELALAAMLTGGHVLIEDVPGVAKTVLARSLARVFDLDFKRVQMTPDLLPADLTGTGVWDEHERKFVFQPGPVFCQILLADELNRATPRTQAGLLEAMEERTVSAEGERYPLPDPFFVIATQNPIEQQGVFPLPEAQLDRFLIQIAIGYPSLEDEVQIVDAQMKDHPIDHLRPVASMEDFEAMREAARAIHIDPSVLDYMVRLARSTRHRDEAMLGASPRASLGMSRMARALAYVRGEAFVRPDMVKAVAAPVLRHRISLTPQARLSGLDPGQVVASLLEEVQAPIYE